jgi:S-adenosylmethionine:tRNA-ribosyltransferase-isomerase (queuine synthetase)
MLENITYRISDFDYYLPQELIAQTPIEPRDASRLLVLNRASRTFEHRHFRDIGAYLRPGDLLIANQSRVMTARLPGRRVETGGAVEVLLLAERLDLGPDYWETLVRPGRRLREGARIVFGDEATVDENGAKSKAKLLAEILQRTEAGGRIARFSVENRPGSPMERGRDKSGPYATSLLSPGRPQGSPSPNPATPALTKTQSDKSNVGMVRARGADDVGRGPLRSPSSPKVSGEVGREELGLNVSVRELIEQVGRMPLPPYIHEPLRDPERYQTVYARITGSAAAPTAGLHFTPQLLERLRQQGVRIGFVTLHVGLDTFRPIECEDIREHKMHSEEIDVDAPTAELINETRRAGGRVVAVGTTAVRVLESVASFYDGRIEPYHGATRLFITPGYRFQVVDALITNFHLPRSTLLLLVSAFAGKTLIEEAYQEAMRERYRFYSFGDAMLIL